jgi:hypothetical protein
MLVQNFAPKKKALIMTSVFECFQSHYHILKKLQNVLCMTMGKIPIMWKGNYIFCFVSYGLATKSVGAGCTV